MEGGSPALFSAGFFPHRGKKFSTVWKKTGRIFHAMEKMPVDFPHHGKKFSTVWKTGG